MAVAQQYIWSSPLCAQLRQLATTPNSSPHHVLARARLLAPAQSSCTAAGVLASATQPWQQWLQLRQQRRYTSMHLVTQQQNRGTHSAVACQATTATEAAAVTPDKQAVRVGPAKGVNSQAGKHVQTLDYTALVACCHELSNSWVPSKVEEVVQPDKYTLALRLRTPLAQGWLHLSWHPAAARLCMGQPPARGDVSEAFSFVQQVSAALRGLVLLSVKVPAPWERVAQLDFGNRPGEAPSKCLYCEVMAKYSNVVVTDADGAIQQCAYQVGGSMSSLRQVQQGRPYQLPPRLSGIPPSQQEPLSSWQENVTRAAALISPAHRQTGHTSSSSKQQPRRTATAEAAAAAGAQHPAAAAGGPSVLAGATRAYMGVSPSLVEEICASAGVLPSADPSSLTPEAWQSLYTAWQAWLARLEDCSFCPSSCPSSRRFSVLGSYPQSHESVHDMVDRYYYSLQAGEVYSGLHQRLSSAVKGALKKARGRVRSFEQQLEAANDAAGVQKQADIIVANLYRIPEGAAEVQAEDWDTGEPVSIALDPTKAPMEVAEGLYKRARKLRRAVEAVQPLLEAARTEVEYLESVEVELSQMPPGGAEQELPALREVQEELIESKVIKPPPEAALSAKAASKGRKATKRSQKAAVTGSTAAAAAAAAGGAGLRQYTSPGGFTVLVGRNNKQNDVLSHQVAKAGDVWMHVRGLPGSHTVLKVMPGQQPDQQDLQYAADLAAWFSKARAAGKVDVIVARAEHLKKPKGAKPGQVLVNKEEGNIVARPANSAAAAAGDAADGS